MERDRLVTEINSTPSYEGFGEELNAGVAMWQAASALDVAATLAIGAHDVSKLLDISAMWLGMAERLTSGFGEDEDEEEEEQEKAGFGFGNIKKNGEKSE